MGPLAGKGSAEGEEHPTKAGREKRGLGKKRAW